MHNNNNNIQTLTICCHGCIFIVSSGEFLSSLISIWSAVITSSSLLKRSSWDSRSSCTQPGWHCFPFSIKCLLWIDLIFHCGHHCWQSIDCYVAFSAVWSDLSGHKLKDEEEVWTLASWSSDYSNYESNRSQCGGKPVSTHGGFFVQTAFI